MRDSSWLRPGEPRCDTCRGSGENYGRTCEDCRGFGSAAPPADAPIAPVGTICRACGNPGTAADPVVTAGPVIVHRSHEGGRR
jgi:hypothetical protein